MDNEEKRCHVVHVQQMQPLDHAQDLILFHITRKRRIGTCKCFMSMPPVTHLPPRAVTWVRQLEVTWWIILEFGMHIGSDNASSSLHVEGHGQN